MKTYKERRRYRAPEGFYNLERQELSERSGGYDHYYHMDRHTSGSSFVDGEATEIQHNRSLHDKHSSNYNFEP